jgi:hypothetical protein
VTALFAVHVCAVLAQRVHHGKLAVGAAVAAVGLVAHHFSVGHDALVAKRGECGEQQAERADQQGRKFLRKRQWTENNFKLGHGDDERDKPAQQQAMAGNELALVPFLKPYF